MIRTRFAPSPTGYLHIGGARAALFNALFATKHQGVFILRMEDTDVIRSDEKFAEQQQADMHWIDIYWQEGPGVDGPYKPYWESQRQPIYNRYYEILEAKQEVYPCFCTDQELNLARKLQLSRGLAPRYNGTCRKLSVEAIQQKIAEGKPFAWRFKVPTNQVITFTDLIRGQQVFKSDDIGDFIIRRANGTAPFLFCNAIDDAEMKVSHVLRGEDHLANTPRQILILQALDLPHPQYGHLSLIVGDDGAPLSKRHGSYSLTEMRAAGYLPLAILNYLARLGHACEAQGLLNFQTLSEHFNLEKLSKSPARFDATQLLYWQKTAVQQLSIDELWRWLGESVYNQVPQHQQTLFAETIKSNITFPHDAVEWANIFFHQHVQIDAEGAAVVKDAGEQFFVEAEQAIDRYGEDLANVLTDMKKTLGIGGKKLFMPLRIALTGKVHGPELAQIAALLGTKKMKTRLGQAFKLASEKE